MQKPQPPSYLEAIREKKVNKAPPPSYEEVVKLPASDSPEPQPPNIEPPVDVKRIDPVMVPVQEDMPPPIPAHYLKKQPVADKDQKITHNQNRQGLLPAQDQKQIGGKVPVNSLLSLVAQGRQDEAEVMIRNHPSLLLEQGDITDGAGRIFTNITALQYAVWALDVHMWTMMLPYFDRLSALGSAGDQLRLLEEKGLGEHGIHFDFKPLLEAYDTLLRLQVTEQLEHLKNFWREGVGMAQWTCPDWVIQEYTGHRPFTPCPNFSIENERPIECIENAVRWFRYNCEVRQNSTPRIAL